MLAEQSGVPHGSGVLIDVRLMHAQLATAIGATRSTVTSLLGDLRLCGALKTMGKGDDERFWLPEWSISTTSVPLRSTGHGERKQRYSGAACQLVRQRFCPRVSSAQPRPACRHYAAAATGRRPRSRR
ncbi:MAG: helix-turn-helix domain-containing protein [Chloroflexaceae bacterium]